MFLFVMSNMNFPLKYIFLILFLDYVLSLPITDLLQFEDYDESSSNIDHSYENYNLHYDERQNGTENYRLHIDGLVIAIPDSFGKTRTGSALASLASKFLSFQKIDEKIPEK